ncbi:unnamed protein product [Owenia fusiformis]|uniref:Uncharacterized protein n=1 Tax=Owenia fusiformis TaxID=6347 RepID=A0A8S4PJH7_OWEFU|nr:unnamed protein product [Owenia fusiformis]
MTRQKIYNDFDLKNNTKKENWENHLVSNNATRSNGYVKSWRESSIMIRVLFIGLLCVGLAYGRTSCSWGVEVAESFNLSSTTSRIFSTKDIVPVNEYIKNLEVYPLIAPKDEAVFAYPYVLKIRLLCQDADPFLQTRRLILFGITPEVHMEYELEDSTYISNTLHGQLLDLMKYPESFSLTHCFQAVCEPIWTAPLPIHMNTKWIHITFTLPGFKYMMPTYSKMISVNGYGTELSPKPFSLLGDSYSISSLDVSVPLSVHQTPNLAQASIASGFTQSNIGLFSEDHFKTFNTFQFDILEHLATSIVCPSSLNITGNDIIDMVVLNDRTIFATVYGLVEVLGTYYSVSTQPTVILQHCVDRVKSQDFDLHTKSYLIAIGHGENNTEIHMGNLNLAEPGSQLAFTTMSLNCSLMCGAINESVTNCTVIDGAISGIEGDTTILLVDCYFAEHAPHFALVKYSAQEDPAMSLQSAIPHTMDSQSDITVHNAPGVSSLPSIEINLTAVAFTRHISPHLYIWGNVLLLSPDQGDTVHMMAVVQEDDSYITTLTSSKQGRIAILLADSQLWYGTVGSIVIHKLYPSAAWGYVYSHHSEGMPDSITINAVYFDIEGDLHILASYEENSTIVLREHTVFVEELLAYGNQMAAAKLHNHPSVALSNPVTPLCNETVPLNDSFIQLCPFKSIHFNSEFEQRYSRFQRFSINPPRTWSYARLHNEASLLLYQAQIQKILEKNKLDVKPYQSEYTNAIEEMKLATVEEMQFLQYQFRRLISMSYIFLDLSYSEKILGEPENSYEPLPEAIHLDYREKYSFSISMNLYPEVSDSGNFDAVRLNFEVSHPSYLSINTTRDEFTYNKSVRYQVTLGEKGEYNVASSPGKLPYPTTMMIRVENSDLQCIDASNGPLQLKDVFTMQVILGCPPGRRLVFDMQATLDRLKTTTDRNYDCSTPDLELPCLYYSSTFWPFFTLVDAVTGVKERFTGEYTLKVIGGSHESKDKIVQFSKFQILTYNNAKSPEPTLIMEATNEGKYTKSGWAVYDSTSNAISWMCVSGSPCTNVPVKFPNSPEYYFLMEVSNVDTGSTDSNCQYTLQFIVKVHGLPIDGIQMSLVIVVCSVLCISSYVMCFYAWYNKQGIRSYLLKFPVFQKILLWKKSSEDFEMETTVLQPPKLTFNFEDMNSDSVSSVPQSSQRLWEKSAETIIEDDEEDEVEEEELQADEASDSDYDEQVINDIQIIPTTDPSTNKLDLVKVQTIGPVVPKTPSSPRVYGKLQPAGLSGTHPFSLPVSPKKDVRPGLVKSKQGSSHNDNQNNANVDEHTEVDMKKGNQSYPIDQHRDNNNQSNSNEKLETEFDERENENVNNNNIDEHEKTETMRERMHSNDILILPSISEGSDSCYIEMNDITSIRNEQEFKDVGCLKDSEQSQIEIGVANKPNENIEDKMCPAVRNLTKTVGITSIAQPTDNSSQPMDSSAELRDNIVQPSDNIAQPIANVAQPKGNIGSLANSMVQLMNTKKQAKPKKSKTSCKKSHPAVQMSQSEDNVLFQASREQLYVNIPEFVSNIVKSASAEYIVETSVQATSRILFEEHIRKDRGCKNKTKVKKD